MKDPLVSVVIPTWNRVKDLKVAVRSVLSQTYQNLEIIISDDGSTDATSSSIATMAAQDNRIHYLSGKHKGLPAIGRNMGITASKGVYVAFLDSDDQWYSNKLESQIKTLTENDGYCICSNANRKKSSWQIFKKPFISNIPREIDILTLIKSNDIVCSSVVVKKSYLGLVGNFSEDINLKGYEDYELWLRMATYHSYIGLNEMLLNYQDLGESTVRQSNGSDENKISEVFASYKKWLNKQNISISQKTLINSSIVGRLAL